MSKENKKAKKIKDEVLDWSRKNMKIEGKNE